MDSKSRDRIREEIEKQLAFNSIEWIHISVDIVDNLISCLSIPLNGFLFIVIHKVYSKTKDALSIPLNGFRPNRTATSRVLEHRPLSIPLNGFS